jgi:hypothetical protein
MIHSTPFHMTQKKAQNRPTTTLPWLPPISVARQVAEIARDKQVTKAQPILPHFLYRGRTTLLVAPPKTGKTTWVWQVISAVANGSPVLGADVPQCRVLVLALEEALGDTKDRILESGLAKNTNVFVLSDHQVPGHRPFEVLEANVAIVKPDVIIIDTLSVYAQTEVASENDSNAWLAVLPEINKLAHRLDIAVLLIHHTDKAGTSARGSSTITAVPDNLAYLSEVKGQPSTVRQLTYKGRQSKSGSFLMDYDPSTRTYRKLEAPEPVTTSSTPARGDKAAPSVQQRLVALMQARTHANGALYADLRKQAKAKGETVDAALKAMVAAGTARKTRDGRAYRYAVVN